jgi:hypothetical protein
MLETSHEMDDNAKSMSMTIGSLFKRTYVQDCLRSCS